MLSDRFAADPHEGPASSNAALSALGGTGVPQDMVPLIPPETDELAPSGSGDPQDLGLSPFPPSLKFIRKI